MTLLRIAGWVQDSVVDGPGIRFALFAQGCPHRCAGCHNPQTHDFEGGSMMPLSDIFGMIQANPLLSGVTFSGGEPFAQAEALAELAIMIQPLRLPILVYTGYTWEELLDNPRFMPLLTLVDAVVDGRFVEAQRSLSLRFRGSANQRIVDVKRSLVENQLMELHWD